MAKQGRFLLQVDVYAAKEHPRQADALFVGPQRRVSWHEQNLDPELRKRRGKRVVVQTGPAIAARSPGGEIGDLHGNRMKEVRRGGDQMAGTGHQTAGGIGGYYCSEQRQNRQTGVLALGMEPATSGFLIRAAARYS